ncbi:hypothetical protein HHI36_006797 [Cryptolaemus montrouzieri]|uniref:Tyr recombinase domain-containing protein n=1 Tax=Cryptolaemus montrouzieri TaxID=559131 RepID=A0ABD2NYM4_9CUCU
MLVEATKAVSKYDSIKRTFALPTDAMNIYNSLKQCCDIAIHMIMKSQSSYKNFEQKPHSCLVQKVNGNYILSSNFTQQKTNLVETYVDCSKNQESYEEFHEAVSNTERLLLQNLKIIVIRGKRGKPVPVLLSTDIQAHIAELLKFRARFLKEDNPFLFGNPGFQSSIVGYKVVSKYAASCGSKNPKALKCTKLRKHLATLTQRFNMNDKEINQLAGFMGHTVGVHENSYRLPDDVITK